MDKSNGNASNNDNNSNLDVINSNEPILGCNIKTIDKYNICNVYFENGIIHFYGEEIDINSVPDIMGRNCQQKFTNYVKWRLKGHDIRLNKF